MLDVKTLITARRFETLTVHQLVQNFSTSECEWLAGPHSTEQKRVSVSDAIKRRELLEEFLFWYFDGFLIPLIRVSLSPVFSEALVLTAYRQRST